MKSKVDDLMKLAFVDTDNADARAWLINALTGCAAYKDGAPQASPKDHDEELETIKALSDELRKRIEFLRMPERAGIHSDFWINPIFGKIEAGQIERANVFDTLDAISTAAEQGMWNLKGRPKNKRKQEFINIALGFFVRFSSKRPTQSPTGPFGSFAHEFYMAVTGQDESVEAQVRHAVKTHLGIAQERARHLRRSGFDKRPPK